LLTVLELLQSHGSIAGPEIARRLEVDVRSVRRYITMLRDMGIPIEAERGREGAYHLRPGYRLPPLMFTSDEIMAVVLGLMIARKLALANTAGTESAAAKIERVLPLEVRERIWAVQSALTFHLQSRADAPPAELVAALSWAAHTGTRAQIQYRDARGGDTAREIDPYGVVYHAGMWYTVGHCHLRDDLRVFRLDRIGQILLRETRFERPEGFDPLAYVLESIALAQGGWEVEVLLCVPLDEARRLVPPDVGALEAVDGGSLMRSTAGSLEWMARFLVWIGCPFEVRNPPELRDVLRGLGERLARANSLELASLK
jgi:predicted DNA-binding transcriptional regulator YafY